MPVDRTISTHANSVVLAIETSQRLGGVVLQDREGVLHQESIDSRRRREDRLMPAIAALFDRAALQPAELDIVAVSIGPGGFTGLRIAVTTAKLLAECTTAKIAAVPSALVAAIASRNRLDQFTSVAVALSGKRDAVWMTECRQECESSLWRIVGGSGVVDVASFRPSDFDCLLADQHLPPSFTEKCEAAHLPIVEPRWSANACLSAAITILKRDGESAAVDPLELNPIYARRPEAVTIWDERSRGRQG